MECKTGLYISRLKCQHRTKGNVAYLSCRAILKRDVACMGEPSVLRILAAEKSVFELFKQQTSEQIYAIRSAHLLHSVMRTKLQWKLANGF